MENTVRYEVHEEIAAGDFATVYRGQDLQLGREVAIKQLHKQYLNSPKLTERYWQEAQLLATLEHPNVMTIYDVVPDRGWLILELMKGSLKDRLGGRAIRLSDLRLTILFAARALSFFQQQGILHGDVKPSNLLIDRNNRIKLGDFGIARRLQGDDGSAIKGTTRYIAPEVVSDNFGPVGPHSDIYSLGFSAYELLCGERFESLFPGLHMFGRDQQLAWIMWHSAPDRRLPKIEDVLEGVPKDLAVIIERMINKDPAQRYRSADEVIADLSRKNLSEQIDALPQQQEEAEQEARRARRKRYLSIGALLFSLLLCLAMLWPRHDKPVVKPPSIPSTGIVGKIADDDSKIYLKSEESIVVGKHDLILLNNAICQLSDLKPNDKLKITVLKGPEGETKRIQATRTEASQILGTLAEIDESKHRLILTGSDKETQEFLFDGETTVSLNDQSTTLANLKPGDSLVVHYWTDEAGAHAESLEAKRQLSLSGTLVSFDLKKNEVTFQAGDKTMTMALEDDCSIRLNNRTSIAGHVVTLADLSSGDEIVSIHYDARVRRMDLHRDISDIGQIWSVDVAGNRLTLIRESNKIDVSVGNATIDYHGKKVELSFLRKGDQLVVAHESPDRKNVSAKSIEVTDLVRDPRVIAIVISQQQYDSIQVTPYQFASRNADLVHQMLDTGARVPGQQLAMFTDLTREKLIQAIDTFLASQEKRPQLIVYFVGQAYVDLNTDITYLAERDFALDNMNDTGLKLRDLIGTMEKFQSREKILILDSCHKVSANEIQMQPSAEQQIRKTMVGDAISRSVTVIGSCSVGQRGAVDQALKHGVFGLRLAEALEGKADSDRDGMVSCHELFPYLKTELASINQTPVRFDPDTRPRRLTPEAATAIRRMLLDLNRIRPSKGFETAYAEAQRLAPRQPDPQLAFAIIKLKVGKTGESINTFLTVMDEHPDALVAFHGAAYQDLVKKDWRASAGILARMVQRIAVRKKDRSQYMAHLLHFAGLARELIAAGAPGSGTGDTIDAAAKKLDPDELAQYESGRRYFTDRYKKLPDNQRVVLRYYYHFDFNIAKQYLLEQLDK